MKNINPLVINFVGIFNAPGYVGEVSDETHIARELEKMGHTIRRIPRDAWREYVIEDFPEGKYDVPKDLKADINLVAKWHHFFDGSFITALRAQSGDAPVFYWVWDFMYDQGFPDWHIKMAQSASLYLSGEAGIFDEYKKLDIKPYYFQMDICDGEIPVWIGDPYENDVIFTGSHLGQGHRIEWLQKINAQIPVKIWSWNYQDWKKLGFEAHPAVYGEEYNQLVAKSKIVLGFSVEPNCWGYWSNRVGKVIRAGGFLLQEYAPGMEQFLPQSVKYFSSPEEAIELIHYYLSSTEHIQKKHEIAQKAGGSFTSRKKVHQLATLMERYLKGEPSKWNQLP